MLELRAELDELVDLGIEARDLVVDQCPQAFLHGCARAVVPQRDEVADLVEVQSQPLGPADEREPFDRPVVVHPVPARRSPDRREEPHTFVVPQRRRGNPRLPRQLVNQDVGHNPSLKVEPGFNVKGV